jgi:hypothetical protein
MLFQSHCCLDHLENKKYHVLSGDVLVKGGGNVWHLHKIDQELENIEQVGGHVAAGDLGRRTWKEEVQDPLAWAGVLKI